MTSKLSSHEEFPRYFRPISDKNREPSLGRAFLLQYIFTEYNTFFKTSNQQDSDLLEKEKLIIKLFTF